MTTNADCTLYNSYHDASGGTVYVRTVLRGVYWENKKGISFGQAGVTTQDGVTVIIPFSVDAEGKQYLAPKEWEQASDKSAVWTLQPTKAAACKIVRGIVEKDLTASYRPKDLEAEYDDVFTITTVETLNIGSQDMQHWEVYAK